MLISEFQTEYNENLVFPANMMLTSIFTSAPLGFLEHSELSKMLSKQFNRLEIINYQQRKLSQRKSILPFIRLVCYY